MNSILDIQRSKYTCTIQEMTEIYGIELNFNNVPFYHGKKDEIKLAITDYFLFREIGYDTIGMFNHAFNRRMRLIMPVFNRLYELDDSITDWFENVDYTTTKQTTHNEDTTLKRNEDGENTQVDNVDGENNNNENVVINTTDTKTLDCENMKREDFSEKNTISKETTGENEATENNVSKITENKELNGENNTDSESSINVNGKNTSTDSGKDNQTFTKKDKETSNSETTSKNTQNTNGKTDTTDNLFKVYSSLPQNMVTSDQIGSNIWAETAEKNKNVSDVSSNSNSITDFNEDKTSEVNLTSDSTNETVYGKVNVLEKNEKTENASLINSTNKQNENGEQNGESDTLIKGSESQNERSEQNGESDRVINETINQNENGEKNTTQSVISKLNTTLSGLKKGDFSKSLQDVGNIISLNDVSQRVKGNTGTKYLVELVPLIRSTILNIPQMIIAELENLFMGVW